MKKRLSVLLFAALLAVMLSGCSGSPQESASPTAAPEAAASAPPEAEMSPGAGSEAPDSESAGEPLSFFGEWEVMDYQSSEVSTLSAEEMEAFRGTAVTYQPDAVLLNGEAAAEGITYKTDGPAYDYDSLTEAYNANLGEWWNNIGEVTGISSGSDAGFFGDRFFKVDPDTIWIYYEGVFFLAKSADA